MVCIGQFGLLSTQIRLSFVASCLVPTLQQAIDRTGVHRKALCQFLYTDTLIVSFQNQLSSFIVQHCTHLLCLYYITFSQWLKHSAVLLKIAIIVVIVVIDNPLANIASLMKTDNTKMS